MQGVGVYENRGISSFRAVQSARVFSWECFGIAWCKKQKTVIRRQGMIAGFRGLIMKRACPRCCGSFRSKILEVQYATFHSMVGQIGTPALSMVSLKRLLASGSLNRSPPFVLTQYFGFISNRFTAWARASSSRPAEP